MNWHEYPQWNPQSLSTAVPNLDDKGLDLLSKMLKYEPSMRISAKKAMEHPYFDDLNKECLWCYVNDVGNFLTGEEWLLFSSRNMGEYIGRDNYLL